MAALEYTLDNDWPQTKKRLSILEKYLDPQTEFLSQKSGLKNGWQCLEIGPGAGSILRYFCDAVGPEGHVRAIDINTALIQEISLPNLTIHQADITQENLPENTYDFVHARGVFVHIS